MSFAFVFFFFFQAEDGIRDLTVTGVQTCALPISDGEGWLSSLIPLRADLMRGDHRCLYLAWLCSIQASSLEDNVLEPPVPAGLGNLSARLERLADFLCIDFDLIAAAVEQSEVAEHQELSKEEIAH